MDFLGKLYFGMIYKKKTDEKRKIYFTYHNIAKAMVILPQLSLNESFM